MRAFASGVPAGRSTNFVTEQLQSLFAMIFQKAANVGLVAHQVGLAGFAFENKRLGQPLLVALPRHFLLPQWFSWAH